MIRFYKAGIIINIHLTIYINLRYIIKLEKSIKVIVLNCISDYYLHLSFILNFINFINHYLKPYFLLAAHMILVQQLLY